MRLLRKKILSFVPEVEKAFIGFCLIQIFLTFMLKSHFDLSWKDILTQELNFLFLIIGVIIFFALIKRSQNPTLVAIKNLNTFDGILLFLVLPSIAFLFQLVLDPHTAFSYLFFMGYFLIIIMWPLIIVLRVLWWSIRKLRERANKRLRKEELELGKYLTMVSIISLPILAFKLGTSRLLRYSIMIIFIISSFYYTLDLILPHDVVTRGEVVGISNSFEVHGGKYQGYSHTKSYIVELRTAQGTKTFWINQNQMESCNILPKMMEIEHNLVSYRIGTKILSCD